MRTLIVSLLLSLTVASACGSAGSPPRATTGPGSAGTEEPKGYPQPTRTGY